MPSTGFKNNEHGRFQLKIAYNDAGDRAKVAAEVQKFPCAKGCAWCCYSPLLITDGDLALLTAWLEKLPPDEFARMKTRLEKYAEKFEGPARQVIKLIATKAPHTAPSIFAKTWPKEGLPCPLLDETGPGEGSCAAYDARPLRCRMHFAMGPQGGAEACSPEGAAEGVKRAHLDSGRVEQKVISEHKLSLVGLLGIELAETAERIEKARGPN